MNNENNEFRNGIDSVLYEKPSKLLWLIPSLIGVLIISIFLWLSYSQVDVIAPSSGKVIPSTKMILIQPKEISVIKNIFVKAGQRVKRNEILVEFKNNVEFYENSNMKAQSENLKAERLFLDNFIKYIKNKQKMHIPLHKDISINRQIRVKLELENNINLYKVEESSLKNKIVKIKYEANIVKIEFDKKTKLLVYSEKRLEQVKLLVKDGLEAQIIFEDLEKEYIQEKSNIKIKEDEIKKLEAEFRISKEELALFKFNTLSDLYKKLTSVSNELNTLKSQLEKSNFLLSSKLIKSPINGTIYNLRNRANEEVIQSGDTIMEIIPDNSPLEVEAKVLNRDIGFVNIGQKVKVKLDSFKFTKYGYIEGVITNIEKASILDENLGEIYPITVELKKDEMKIDNRIIKIIPGMTCTVDIKIGKRKLIDYIISPMIRYRDEALRER